jgi:hypothetical protein
MRVSSLCCLVFALQNAVYAIRSPHGTRINKDTGQRLFRPSGTAKLNIKNGAAATGINSASQTCATSLRRKMQQCVAGCTRSVEIRKWCAISVALQKAQVQYPAKHKNTNPRGRTTYDIGHCA